MCSPCSSVEFRMRCGVRSRLVVWRVPDRHDEAQMLYLLVRASLIDGVDRAAGHARLVHDYDPVGRRVGLGAGLDNGIHRIAVLPAGPVGAETLIGQQQCRHAEAIAHPLIHRTAGGRDVDVTVGGGEDSGRHAGRVVVAGLGRHMAGHGPARHLGSRAWRVALPATTCAPIDPGRDFAFEEGG